MESKSTTTCFSLDLAPDGAITSMSDATRDFLRGMGLGPDDARRLLPENHRECVSRCASSRGEPVSATSVVEGRSLFWVFIPAANGTPVQAFGFAAAGPAEFDPSNPAANLLFQTIVDSGSAFFYTHDKEGRFQYLSPSALELLEGVPDISSLRWSDLLTDNPVNLRGTDLTAKALETGEKQPPYELELKLPDGRRVWVEVNEAPHVCDGKVVGMIGSAHEVTQRIRAASVIRESEERYRALIERSPVGIGIIRDRRFVYANPRGAEILGYTREEIVGKEAWHFVHPGDKQTIERRVLDRLSGRAVRDRYEVRIVRKDGSTRWLDVAVVPVDFGGKPATMTHGIDITERKKAEQATREAEARYRELYENATDIIYTHDLAFRLLSVNASGERFLGWSAKDFVGKDLRDIIHPDSRALAQRTLEEKLLHPDRPSPPYEIQVYNADREPLWIEVTSRIIMGENGPKAVAGIAREITKRKRLEAQLRQAQKMEALGQLAGGVAHDFNNLLTGIMGYTRLLARRNQSDPKALEELSQIEYAADRAAGLTRQLLAFSRQQPMRTVQIDVNQTVADVVSLLSRTVGERVKIAVNAAKDLPRIQGDAAQIEQVLLNLTVNARDAMPDGGEVTIHTTTADLDAQFVATHPWAKIGHFVQLSVVDTGVGMQPHVRDRVFEPFFTTKPPDKGTGLGLSIVYGIIQQHDGLVDVESVPGQGTAFHVYFPVSDKPAEPVRVEALGPVRGGSETILLAEDEPMVRNLACEILTSAGYSVTAVEDGQKALRLLDRKQKQFDLVILDMVMPKVGGAEVWRAMQDQTPGLRVLLTSGYATESVDLQDSSGPLPHFLAKPFAPDALLKKVREALEADAEEAET